MPQPSIRLHMCTQAQMHTQMVHPTALDLIMPSLRNCHADSGCSIQALTQTPAHAFFSSKGAKISCASQRGSNHLAPRNGRRMAGERSKPNPNRPGEESCKFRTPSPTIEQSGRRAHRNSMLGTVSKLNILQKSDACRCHGNNLSRINDCQVQPLPKGFHLTVCLAPPKNSPTMSRWNNHMGHRPTQARSQGPQNGMTTERATTGAPSKGQGGNPEGTP